MNKVYYLNDKTAFIERIDSMGDDLTAINSARISFDKKSDYIYEIDWENDKYEDGLPSRTYSEVIKSKKLADKDRKLLKYLLTNGHWSVFDQAFIKFRIKAPMFIRTQHFRHQSWCLSGDTDLFFKLPSGQVYKKKLREFYRQWNEGATPIPHYLTGTPLKIPLKKRLQNMQLMMYDEVSKEIQTTEITDVWKSGIKDVYKMTLDNGLQIKASLDHNFLTTNGWKSLSFIRDNQTEILSLGDYTQLLSKRFELNLSEEELKNEKWVSFYKNPKYEISDLGRVRNLKNTRNKLLIEPTIKKCSVNSQGRLVFSWSENGNTYVEHLSVAVFSSFNKNSLSDRQNFICHFNDNPLDNRLENLYQGTPKSNSKDKFKNGFKEKNKYKTIRPSKVVSVELIGTEEVFDITVKNDNHNFIANGIVTHNCFNEVSARYTEVKPEFYTPKNFRAQSTNNRQASTGDIKLDDNLLNSLFDETFQVCYDNYQKALENALSREQARALLPQSTYTEYIATASLRSLIHFIKARKDPHAQYEIRLLAEEMEKLARSVFPETFLILDEVNHGKS